MSASGWREPGSGWRVGDGTRELKIRRATRVLCFGAIIGCAVNVWLYVFIVPASYWPIGVFAAVMAILAAQGFRRQTREIRRLQDARRRLTRACAHLGAVPVEQRADLGGETVAWLCPKCGEQLSLEWAIESGASSRAMRAEAFGTPIEMKLRAGLITLNAAREAKDRASE